MKPALGASFGVILLAGIAVAQSPSTPKPPETPKRPVTDEYHGLTVRDDYRWLEDWNDPETKRWSAAQNTYARAYLDRLPARAAIRERFKELISESSAGYFALEFRGGLLFALRSQPPQQQAVLVTLRSTDDPAGSARVIFDPNAANHSGSLAVDYYSASLDGKYVAVAVSLGGSEDASARVFEVASSKELTDVVPRVNFATAGGSIAWKADDSGFYYTRYPQGNERSAEDSNFYQQVYFHKLGTDSKQDSYMIGKEFPRIAEIQLRMSDDGRWLLAAVANGDGGEFAHYVMDTSSKWTQVTRFEDGVVSVQFGPKDQLYLLSLKGAPRGRVLGLEAPTEPLSRAKLIVAQSSGEGAEENRFSIESLVTAGDSLFVTDIIGGPSRLRVFDDRGTLLTTIEPPVSAIGQVVPLGGSDALLLVASYLAPPVWLQFDHGQQKLAKTGLLMTAPSKFDDAEVTRAYATSKDGTRVPLNIVRRKGTKLDGTNPTLLYGYGGYSISEKPHFLGAQARVWLDQGGVYVQANLRGGGEYGEEWHKAGNLTRKQNVFDDFLACAQYLIDQKYTTPQHLAIIGGSNGGLLMGAALTQRPEMFRAVASFVGVYDMLRVELDPNGQFNVTEYGTVKDADQFKALYAYSPYHHVKDGTPYPAILFLTGENDHRVNPMESRKMTARLQAANGSGLPILLRTSSNAGHGIGTSLDERTEQNADVFAFLFDQLGVRYRPAGQ
jgi:prolyl oligopeptidase